MAIRKYFLALLISYVVANQLSNTVVAQNPTAKNGIIDLTQISWRNNVIKLSGEWDFYWNEFVLPTKSNDTIDAANHYFSVLPSSWTKIVLNNNKNCPTQGYGTYRLRIKVPNRDQVYGLKLQSVFTAYKVFINSKLINSLGQTGKSKTDSRPKFLTQEIPIPVIQNGTEPYQWVDVVMQVSNFHHRRAGAQQPIMFGTMDEIINTTSNTIILNLLLIGIILIIGLNHLLMYFLRRTDLSNLIFGILCVVMILRNLSTGERVMMHLFPNLSWEMLVRLDNFSGFATISLFAFYFYFLFKSEFPKTMFYLITGIGVIITLLVFTTNAYFYGQFRTIFELYILVGGLYITFGVLLRAAFKKRPGGLLTFLGMFVLYATAINDVLSSMGLIHTFYVAPYGIAFFMVLESYLLTRQSAFALKKNEQLSDELQMEKQNLEKHIEERTAELSKQASELEQYRQVQEKQNWINDSLNAISDVMHQNRENLSILADQLLATLLKRVNGNLGALYFLVGTGDESKLKLIANYGLNVESMIEELDVHEGLPGKCFSSGKEIIIEELPDKYFTVTSGLGNSKPSFLLLMPLINDEKAIGVLEIASFNPLQSWQMEFLHKALISIAGQLNIVKINADTKLLLESYKTYETELRQKESEFHELQLELATLREKSEQVN
jgi:hypothetical protein